jgi:putative ABC transport system permease protein
MWRVTLRGIKSRPIRFALSCLAVISGVAFVVASLTLTATIRRNYDDLFADLSAGTDIQVREKTDVVRNGVSIRRRIADDVLDEVRKVDGVELAVARTQGVAYIVGTDGKVVGGPDENALAADPIAGSWVDDQRLTPFRLLEGRPPRSATEFVVDRKSARDGNLRVGEKVGVLTKGDPVQMTLVGVVRFGTAESPAGAPVLLFAPDAAAELIGEPGKADSIDIVLRSGATKMDVLRALTTVIPKGMEAVDGQTVTKERQAASQERLKFFSAFLSLFAVLSVLMGTFVIANTFAVTVAQRTRELALLRTLGAFRSQVVRVVLGEALLVGLVASILGVGAGIALAAAARKGIAAAGLVIPPGDAQIGWSTVLIGCLVGVGTTVVAAGLPARRSSRVAPMQALRETAVEQPTSWRRSVLGAAVVMVSVWVLLYGANLPSLRWAAFGTLGLVSGVLIASPALAWLVSGVFGRTLTTTAGITGRLAGANANRSPRRTASMAMALVIGAAVSAFAAVFAASLQVSLRTAVSGGIRGDFVIQGPGFGIGGLPPSLAQRISALPEINAASGVRFGFANVTGPKRKPRTRTVVARSGARPIAAFDAKVADRLIDVRLLKGTLADLGPGRIAVSRREMNEKGWNLGDELTITFAEGTSRVKIVTTYASSLLFDFAMSIDAFAPMIADDFDFSVYIRKNGDVPKQQARVAIEKLTASVPLAKVRDQDEVTKSLTSSVDQLFTLVLGLMTLAVAVAVLGIAITLTLIVRERTRELGLLRAIGMGSRQARTMVRLEAIVVSIYATILGAAVGLAAGWGLTRALRTEGLGEFRIPVPILAALIGLSALAGIVASIIPARRAAKVDILSALKFE